MKKTVERPSKTSKRPLKKRTKARRTTDEIMEVLLEAAHEEFRVNGYRNSKVSDIVKKAGITEAQLYRYFSSKSELFSAAVFNPLNDHILSFVTRQFADDRGYSPGDYRDLDKARRIYMAEMQPFIDDHSQILLSLIANEHSEEADSDKMKPVPSLQKYFDMVSRMGSDFHDKNSAISSALLVRISFSTILATELFRDWIFPEGMASTDDIRKAVIEFVSKGLK